MFLSTSLYFLKIYLETASSYIVSKLISNSVLLPLPWKWWNHTFVPPCLALVSIGLFVCLIHKIIKSSRIYGIPFDVSIHVYIV